MTGVMITDSSKIVDYLKGKNRESVDAIAAVHEDYTPENLVAAYRSIVEESIAQETVQRIYGIEVKVDNSKRIKRLETLISGTISLGKDGELPLMSIGKALHSLSLQGDLGDSSPEDSE